MRTWLAALVVVIFAVVALVDGQRMISMRYWPPYTIANATYGAPGQFGASFAPGARIRSMVWRDTLYKELMWVYGGSTLICDLAPNGVTGSSAELWAYNSTSHQWAFMNGTRDDAGVPLCVAQTVPTLNPGTIGVYDAYSKPSARIFGAVWAPTDTPGVAYMYGGTVQRALASASYPTDTQWSWDSSRRMWAYWGTSSLFATNAAPGTFSQSNNPGRRKGAAFFTALDNTMYLFGGDNGQNTTTPLASNDVWAMTRVGGVPFYWKCVVTATSFLNYGTLGVESASVRFVPGINSNGFIDYANPNFAWIGFGGSSFCNAADTVFNCSSNALFRLNLNTGALAYFGGDRYPFNIDTPGASKYNSQGVCTPLNSPTCNTNWPPSRVNPNLLPGSGTANQGIMYLFSGSITAALSGSVNDAWALNTQNPNNPRWMWIQGNYTIYTPITMVNSTYFSVPSAFPCLETYNRGWVPHRQNPYVYTFTSFVSATWYQSAIVELSVLRVIFMIPPAYDPQATFPTLVQPIVSVAAHPVTWTQPVNDAGMTIELTLDPPVTGVTLTGNVAPIVNGYANFTSFNVSRPGTYSVKVEVVMEGYRSAHLKSDPFSPPVAVPCCKMADIVTAVNGGSTSVALAVGTYTGNCDNTNGGMLFTSPVQLRGKGQGVTFLDCQGAGGRILSATLASSPTAIVISDLTIRGGLYTINNSGAGMGIYAYDASMVLDHVTFTNNNASDATQLNNGGAIWAGASGSKNYTTFLYVRNCIFTANSACNGAAIRVDTGNFLMENSVFTSNSIRAGGNGYALFTANVINSETIYISGCRFQSNTGTGHSAFIHANNPGFTGQPPHVISIDNAFIDNNGQDEGSGLLIDTALNVTIRGNKFTNNTSCTKYGLCGGQVKLLRVDNAVIENSLVANGVSGCGSAGAGAYVRANTLAVRNTTFANNYCGFIASNNANMGSLGGGLAVDHIPIVSIDGCTFINNTANASGGGLYMATGTQASITNTVVTGNSGWTPGANGGGVAVTYFGQLTMSNVTFTNNGQYYGAALEITQITGLVDVSRCVFINNNHIIIPGTFNASHGGHIHTANVTTARFTWCTFGPALSELGGAIHWGFYGTATPQSDVCLQSSNWYFADSVFYGITTQTGGSALSSRVSRNALLTMVRCNFTNNRVTGSYAPFVPDIPSGLPAGGVLNFGVSVNLTLVLTDCVFSNNSDTHPNSTGSIISSFDPMPTTITTTVFSDNTAATPLLGWAGINGTANVSLVGCTFLRNKGSPGGIFYSPSNPALLTVTGTTITSNSFTGPAISLSYPGSGVQVLGGSSFQSITARSVIRAVGSSVVVLSASFINNVNPLFDGGAISASASSSVSVGLASFTGNTAQRGGGIFSADSSLAVTGTVFTSNVALSAFGGGAIWQNLSTANIGSDVTFVGNNNSDMNPRLEGYFGGIQGCTSFSAGTLLAPSGCSGASGLFCSFICPPGYISGVFNGLIQCPTSGVHVYPATMCTAADNARTAFVGGDPTDVTPVYGTRLVPSASNVIGARFGSVVFSSPLLNATAIVFGGSGYNEAHYDDLPANQLFGYGVLLDDTWAINMSSGLAVNTWLLGSRSATTPVLSNYATGIPGGRIHAASFVDGAYGYMHGGYGHGAGPYRYLACMWRISLLAPQNGWSFVAGPQSGNEDGPYGTQGVFAPANTPGGRYGHAMWTLTSVPGMAFLYGGLGLANPGSGQTYGYLSDLWAFNLTTKQWAWLGGNNTAGVGAPSYGSIGVYSINNWPGARGGHTVVTSGDVVYMYGGHVNDKTVSDTNAFSARSDLWQGRYNATRQTIDWTWYANPNAMNSAGSYGAGSNAAISAARAFGALLLSPPLVALQGQDRLLVYGGLGTQPDSSPVIRSDILSYQFVGTYYRGNYLSGDVPPNVFAWPMPAKQVDLANRNPGARARLMAWPDYTRPGVFYVYGGIGAFGPPTGPVGVIRPTNEIWRINVVKLVPVQSTYNETVGTPLTISGRLRSTWGSAPDVTFSEIQSRVSVSAMAADNGQLAKDLTVYTGFVNGDLVLSMDGPLNGQSSRNFTVTVSVYELTMVVSVIVKCRSACATCNTSSLNVSTCACNTADGFSTGSNGACTNGCLPNEWRNAGVCTACATGCVTCTGATLSYGDCQACDEAGKYGRASATGPCVPCTAGGLFLDTSVPKLCVQCSGVTNCKGGQYNVTCTTDQNSQCGTCNAGNWLDNNVADACRGCSTCPAIGYYQTAPCTATSDTVCTPCTVCGGGQYVVSACTANADTICGSCAAIPHCDVAQITCANPTVSRCTQCTSNAFFKTLGDTSNSDVCRACDTCPVGTFQFAPCSLMANVTCLACQFGCAACTQGGRLDVPGGCQTCDGSRGYLLNRAGDACVSSCQPGEFASPGNATVDAQCMPCSVGCTRCTKAGTILMGVGAGCSACDEASGYLVSLDRQECVSQCELGQYRNETGSTHHCTGCSSLNCLSSQYVNCSNPDDSSCPDCSEGCATCTGPGIDLNGLCTSCDTGNGFAPNADGICSPCAANCSLCTDSPTTCSVCATGYVDPPGCKPNCTSPGCLDCYAPDACGLCMGEYKGLDCKACSESTIPGSQYPTCVAARVTDTVATGATMGVLFVLVLVVSFFTCFKPLPVFYAGKQLVPTPSAAFNLKMDFVLTTRMLTVAIDQPIPVESITLEGANFPAEKLAPSEGSAWDKAAFEIGVPLSRPQMHKFLSNQFHLDITANAGSGLVTTKYPLRIPMRRNLPNILTMVTILVDFIQLSALTFSGDTIIWWKSDPVPQILHYTLLILPPNLNFFYFLFFILIGLAAVWVIFVAVMKTGCDQRISRCRCGNKILAPIYSIYMPFVGQTLYLPILSVMLSVMSCSKKVVDPTSPFTANYDQGVTCWTGEHWVYVVIAAVVVVVYYPLAIYTSPMWQTTNPELDVRYFPAFLVASGQIKFILAVTGQLFSAVPYVQSALLIGLCLPLSMGIAWRPATIINSLRWLHMSSYACVAWTGVASFVAVLYPNQWISSVVLYGGWALLFLVSMVATLKPTPDPTSKEVQGEDESIIAVRRLMQGDKGKDGSSGGGKKNNKVGVYEEKEPTKQTSSSNLLASTGSKEVEAMEGSGSIRAGEVPLVPVTTATSTTDIDLSDVGDHTPAPVASISPPAATTTTAAPINEPAPSAAAEPSTVVAAETSKSAKKAAAATAKQPTRGAPALRK